MQHRSNPKLDTLEAVPGLPTKVKLCKIPASPFYYVRTWMDGKPILRSMKTEKQSEARKAAKAFYDELLLRRRLGQPLTEGNTFRKAAEAVLEADRARVRRGECRQSLIRDGEYILPHLVEFFKSDHVKNINFQKIDDYRKHMEAKVGKPSSATIKNHFIWLNKVLKHAISVGLMDKMPIFPKIRRKDNPRPWFTDPEYSKLLETCTACDGTTVEKTYRKITQELRLITAFLVNTYLRPPDLMHMKHSDVHITDHESTQILRVDATSKVEESAVFSTPVAVTVYKRLRQFQMAKTYDDTGKGYGKPDDFIFFPDLSKDRGYAFQTLRLQFNHVLKRTGLKTDRKGRSRTLYSLRHSAIMFRILNGGPNLNMASFAANCRTSLTMLDRFYLTPLRAEMDVGGLVIQGRQLGRQV
jgi:hypothetical protein